MLPRALAVVSFLVACSPSHTTPLPVLEEISTRDIDYRLPTNVIPEAYRIYIRPDYPETGLLGSKTFFGVVAIDVNIMEEPADKLVFHKGPTIKEIFVICVIDRTDKDEDEGDTIPSAANLCHEQQGEVLERSGEEEDAETETFTIHLRDEIPLGRKVRIVLNYDAEYPEGGLAGFYVSTFQIEGKEVALLTSKFEPTHARKAYPCFDEPALKAKFKLFISLKSGIDAISNMAESSKTPGSIVAFETSPVMSTYLLAFIVYETDYFVKSDQDMSPASAILFRTWGRKNMIEDMKGGLLSQVEGPAALEFLEEYTGINYTDTMTKMDMAAIPDFQSGAMENWGLVTYRENALLYNQKTGTATNHKRVVDVIDHELAHMWFGNLVTTSWWSSIWLNEGFARYVQYLVAHDRYPKWHMLERFVLDEHMGALGVDSDAGAPPLTDESVKSPEDIGNHFGTISYSKGGAILRQIENIMGEENFKNGVQEYLKNNILQSVSPSDLFESLVPFNKQDLTGLNNDDLRRVMEEWTEKPGYPLVTVKRSGTTFTVSQERFLLIPDTEITALKYPVYLTWTTSKDETTVTAPKAPQEWLKTSDGEKEITIDISDNDWVLFNVYQGGYYRVNYDDATWTQLSQVLDEGNSLDRVAALDRAALVENALALARAGTITYERALRLLRFLRHDTAFEPWAAARTALAHLQRMLGDQKPFKDFVAYIVEKAYDDTGFDSPRMDTHLAHVHRTNVLTLACSAGYERCLKEAKERLQGYLPEEGGSPVAVHPDLESVVFCYGLKGASPETWEKLWGEYAESDAARRSMLINALGCIDHRKTLEKFLLKSIDPAEIRGQDAYTVFSSVYSNPDGGPEAALDFLTFVEYNKLEQRYGGVRNAMSSLISGLANRLMDENQKKQLEKAVEAYSSRHASSIKTVQSNMDWLQANGASVLKVLQEARTYSAAPRVFFASFLALFCASLLVLLR